jgi:hypothetical protein
VWLSNLRQSNVEARPQTVEQHSKRKRKREKGPTELHLKAPGSSKPPGRTKSEARQAAGWGPAAN